MNCSRCSGLMHAEELRDWHGGMGANWFRALRCLVCGEIVDPVILQNRRNAVSNRHPLSVPPRAVEKIQCELVGLVCACSA